MNKSEANDSETQPIQQAPTAPGQPPNPNLGNAPTTGFEGLGQVAYGVAPTAVPPDAVAAPDTATTWKTKYEKEHKRAKILAGTTAAACLLAVGVGTWGVTKASQPQLPEFASGQLPNGGAGQGGMGGGPGGFGGPDGQGGPSQLLSSLFNSDGSVNTEQLEQFKSRAPQGVDFTEMIDRALQSGAITQDQATKLTAALGSSSNSGTNSSFDSDSPASDSNVDSDEATT